MELEKLINANDEKNASSDDVEVIRRILDEMIERQFLRSCPLKIFYENIDYSYRLKVVCRDESVCTSNSECWRETGIRLLSNSTSLIFDDEINDLKEGPPKKRRKSSTDARCEWSDERAKIRSVVVDADFIQKFS
ncbi:unnamed protein product [Litomosoides sigmodontis]|uniref:Uncharacterized protein n=1 Tax=Litomosoides sigmodontis TaxID=42156 RepID=A0A3P6V6Y6_LITSI|nr:unnamed protein product [Litomosoides sigmodontis]